MTKMQAVIICGNSLFMSGLALTLERQGGFPVLRAANPEEVGQMLPAATPMAILVDGAADRQWAETLAGRCPNALVIAVSPDNSSVRVYSHDKVSTLDDLKKMILKHSPPADCSDIKGSGGR